MRLRLCSCQPASYLQYIRIAGGEQKMHACTAPVRLLVVSVMSLERFHMRATGEAVADRHLHFRVRAQPMQVPLVRAIHVESTLLYSDLVFDTAVPCASACC
jgi:hypothetical protein